MDDVIDRTIAEPKFQTRLLGAFSLTALVLAAIGIYGVLAASVVERRREIGVRVALGADSQTIVRMVLGRGFPRDEPALSIHSSRCGSSSGS